MENNIYDLKKLILQYNEKLKEAEAAGNVELQEEILDSIDQCFAQIAHIELRLSSTNKIGN